MKIISIISDEIEHVLREADKYIECALHKQEEFPTLADIYYKLSEERMKDQELLHGQVVTFINEYKKNKGEPPENMQFLYNYLHEKFIDWAAKIRLKQSMYKSNT